jgi:chromosome segregation ATPase
MATRIYRPTAGRSWREASARSSNAQVGEILAKYGTDLNNKRLKRAITVAEQNMTLADQRADVWGKTYERVGSQVEGAAKTVTQQANQVNQKAEELARIAARTKVLVADIEKRSKAGTLTAQQVAAFHAEYDPLVERWNTLNPVYKAQKRDWNALNRSYLQDQQELKTLYSKYQRSTKRTKQAVNAYKQSVSKYNREFYPVS